MNKISINGLNYKKKNKVILNDINIDFVNNSYTTIIGPVGAGKTTLFKLIISNYNKIKVNGDIKYIVTNPNNQIVARTVEGQLKFFLEMYGYTKRQITVRLKNIIKDFELYNLLSMDPYILSEGEKQLVILLSVLILDLDILIIDNALCRLDSKYKTKIIDYLKKLKKRKTTIINFTSDINEIIYSDRVILLNKTVVLDSKLKDAVKFEKIFYENNLKMPFMWVLSLKLKYYGLVDKIEHDVEKLVDNLWN